MMSENYLQRAIEPNELYSVEAIYQKMQLVFQQHERLLVLLDETLAPHIFDDLKKSLRSDKIIYIPLAKGNGYKDTPLFFFEITDEKILKDIGLQLSEHLFHNFDISNNEYLVYGFGTSDYENDELNRKFKASLVLQDIESKILFRWYDPRVMIYLDQIFNEPQMNSLLGNFNQWHFIHPTGYYQWDNIAQKKLVRKTINKISAQQSLALDLISPSNIVYKNLADFDVINISEIEPKQILRNLHVALNIFNIEKYSDIVGYGLYSFVLGERFMWHPYVQEILKLNWKVQPEDHDFINAMNYISTDDWVLIRNDLKKYNLGT